MLRGTRIVALAVGLQLTSLSPAYAQRIAVSSDDVDAHDSSLLDRQANLSLQDVDLGVALRTLSKRSGVVIAFSASLLPPGRVVSCTCEHATVGTALERLLSGTWLLYHELQEEIAIIPQVPMSPSQPRYASLYKAPLVPVLTRMLSHRLHTTAPVRLVGTIVGTVTVAETRAAVASAQVTVEGTGLGTLTNSDGAFSIAGVPAGRQAVTVTSIGYRTVTHEVEVADDATVTLDFTMEIEPTRLQEVVVTATGEQRRLEVGNVIGTIRADSITREAPVKRLADVLEARVPGVQIIANTGFTGESPRIRIRGISSVSLPRDPLLYIDGVRVENSTGSLRHPSLGFIGNYGHSPGRFNDFSPDEIESIEVVKGPSAATLYGTDAANGVILIRTKRGRLGAPRWSFFAEGGVLAPAVKMPDSYWTWGTNTTTDAVQSCPLVLQAAGTCRADSLSVFSPLNHPETTPIGTGYRRQLGAQVSGGVGQFTYFLAAEHEDEVGYLRMPDAEIARITEERGIAALPSDQLRPNTMRRLNLRSNVGMQLGPRAEVNLSTGVVIGETRIPRGETFFSGYMSPGYRDANDGWRDDRPGELYGIRGQEDLMRYTGSLSGNWQPSEWLTTRATLGLDFSSALFDGLQRRGEGPLGTGRVGRRLNNRTNVSLYTADVNASAYFQTAAGVSSRTTVGVQYNRRNERLTWASAQDLPPGSETVTGAAVLTGGERNVESIVAGTYAEQTFGLNDRLFLTGAARVDGSSSFGQNFRAAVYPKASVSWLLSDEPFMPNLGPLTSIRLRAAYGASGVQPGPTDALALATLFSTLPDGTLTSGAALESSGNPDLRPERQTEYEAGLDLEVANGRVALEATYYDRLSSDALVEVPLPPSVGIASRWENIGSVRNRGLEMLLTAVVLKTPTLSWDVSFNGSINRNRLESIDADIPFIGLNPSSRSRVGYPLFARWTFPILGWADENSDGIIGLDEIMIGDTVTYHGEAHPPRQLTVATGVSLFGEALRLSSQFDYRGGHVNMNFTYLNHCGFYEACQAVQDPSMPLEEQARAHAWRANSNSWAGGMEDGSFWRWREFSATYRLPQRAAQWFGANSMSVTVAGRNLRLWTSYRGPDPEVNSSAGLQILEGSSGGATMPQTRYWTLRVNYDM